MILFMKSCDIPEVYAACKEGYKPRLNQILERLAQQGATSRGRWGGWNYGGMNGVRLKGRIAAEHLAHGN